MKTLFTSLLVLFLSFVLAACGSDTGATDDSVAEAQPPLEATTAPVGAGEDAVADQERIGEEDQSIADEGEAIADEEMADEDEGVVVEEEATDEAEMAAESERPAWQNLPLTNARSGETFTLADFAGKTVFVEPMATWCTNCRRQLGNVRQAREQLDGEDIVFVALSVETNIGDGDLAQYAEAAGFDWVFAVMTPEMLQQLVDTFGRAIGNPPSTPHFVIRPDGTTTELVTGIDPPEQLIAQLQATQ